VASEHGKCEWPVNTGRTCNVKAKETVYWYYQKGDARTDYGSLERAIKFDNLRSKRI
jgi:hypothetical protein